MWNYERSFEYIDRCLSINPNNYLALNYKAYIVRKNGNIEKGILLHQQALETNPNYPHATNGLGEAYYFKKNYEQSIYFFNETIKMKSDYFRAYIGLIDIYLEQKMYDLALEIIEKALQIDSKFMVRLEEQFNYKKSKYQCDLALDYLNIMLKLNGNYLKSPIEFGIAYFQCGKYDLAINSFKKVLFEENISNTDLYTVNNHIGYCFQCKQEYEKALYYYHQAFKSDPSSSETLLQLCDIYSVLEKYDLGLDLIRKNQKNQLFQSDDSYSLFTFKRYI